MSPQNTGLGPLNILVFGPTGVGKSTIINLLTSGHLTVDDSLESCTQKVEAASIQHQGRQINYFDTPGLDDSCLTSAEQLALIGSFVSGLYEAANQAPNIHGILYVHRITDNKMAGSTLRNLRVLEKLLGPDAFKNLVFVTNMWGNQPDPKHVKFEHELITNTKYFESAIANGARAGVDYRICKDASEAQARERLSDLFLDSSPVTLQIQRDMVDNKSALWATTAGRFVNEESLSMNSFELAALSGGGEGRKKRIVLEQEEAEKNYEQAKKQEGILELTLEAIRAHPCWSTLVALVVVVAAGAIVLGSGKVIVVAKCTGAANLAASGTGTATAITASPMVGTVKATGAVDAMVSLEAWGVAAIVGWVIAAVGISKQRKNKDTPPAI